MVGVNVIWSAIGAISTLTAAVVAVITLLSIRKDSRDRTRPIMSADLRPLMLVQGVGELIVENLGNAVAKNITVKFTPLLPSSNPEGSSTPYLRRRYENVIPSMPPGRRLYNVYTKMNNDSNTERTPDEITVTFHYQDTRNRRYNDSYQLTIKTLMNEVQSFPANTDEHGMNIRQIKAIESIARSLGRR